MKALVYTAVRKFELRDIAEPRPGPGEVLVRVAATGICGSDVHGFMGRSARRNPGLVLGHETVGTVQALGEGVDKAIAHTRVSVNPLISCGVCDACRTGRHNVCADWRLLGLDTTQGAFAEAVVVPVRNILPLPEHVSDAMAVMIEPLANAIHLISHTPRQAGMFPTACIFGGGTLGLSILSVARAKGMRVIAVIEPNAARAKVATELGAENVLDPRAVDTVAEIKRMTGGHGVDVSIDAVGLAQTRQQTVASLTRGGTALFLGLEEGPAQFDFFDLIRREIRLQCSFGYNQTDFSAALDFVARSTGSGQARGAADFTRWTDTLPLSDGQAAFERLIRDPGDRVKIALKP